MCEDHPRGCGEHHLQGNLSFWNSGSSPRMRETLAASYMLVFLIRIIPADAGNTIYGLEPEDDHTDHPRGCGEHGGVDLQTVETDGSSPRMRGTQGSHRAGRQQQGIIPADAGNTLVWPPSVIQHGDHPRGCGEH